MTCSPTNMRASRNVPVAITTARPGACPLLVSTPATRPSRTSRPKHVGNDHLDAAFAQQPAIGHAYSFAVRLHARPPNCRALASIEHSAVDRRSVRRARHQAVEHVELANEMPFPDPADRRVARHLPGVFGTESEQADARAAPRRGRRSLAPGMAGADHQNVMHPNRLAHHVSRETSRLLAKTEARKQRVEHVLDSRAAR